MEVKVKILENLKKCIAGIIYCDGIFHENKGYFTLLPSICQNDNVTHVTDGADTIISFNLFDIVNDEWRTVPWCQIKEIKWESTTLYPDDISSTNLTQEYLQKQDEFRTIIKNMVLSEIAEELPRYADYTDHDLRMELYTNTGKRPKEDLTRDELMVHINQLLAIQSTHVINYDQICAEIGGVKLNFGPESVCGHRYAQLQDMSQPKKVAAAWTVWKEIIEWHISLNVRELEQELADAEDEEEREEIETAIELVKSAIDDVNPEQFKSVYEVADYWPPLLFPPPQIALAV